MKFIASCRLHLISPAWGLFREMALKAGFHQSSWDDKAIHITLCSLFMAAAERDTVCMSRGPRAFITLSSVSLMEQPRHRRCACHRRMQHWSLSRRPLPVVVVLVLLSQAIKRICYRQVLLFHGTRASDCRKERAIHVLFTCLWNQILQANSL